MTENRRRTYCFYLNSKFRYVLCRIKLIWILCLLLIYSCNQIPNSVEDALIQAGSNRTELEKVIYYSTNGNGTGVTIDYAFVCCNSVSFNP